MCEKGGGEEPSTDSGPLRSLALYIPHIVLATLSQSSILESLQERTRILYIPVHCLDAKTKRVCVACHHISALRSHNNIIVTIHFDEASVAYR